MYENMAFSLCFGSQDAREGVAAFLKANPGFMDI